MGLADIIHLFGCMKVDSIQQYKSKTSFNDLTIWITREFCLQRSMHKGTVRDEVTVGGNRLQWEA